MDDLDQCVRLRGVLPQDLSAFFDYQSDPEASYMAAFTAKNQQDYSAFMAHWQRILNDEQIVCRSVLAQNKVVGHIIKFVQLGNPSISYWFGKAYWNRGIATQAVSEFLKEVTQRPLYGRVAQDNLASIRVLEKCGFVAVEYEEAFANARNQQITEVVMQLD